MAMVRAGRTSPQPARFKQAGPERKRRMTQAPGFFASRCKARRAEEKSPGASLRAQSPGGRRSRPKFARELGRAAGPKEETFGEGRRKSANGHMGRALPVWQASMRPGEKGETRRSRGVEGLERQRKEEASGRVSRRSAPGSAHFDPFKAWAGSVRFLVRGPLSKGLALPQVEAGCIGYSGIAKCNGGAGRQD